MKRGRWADHPEILVERSRLGVIRAATLKSLDMDSRTIYRKCLPGGPWRRLLPGIILMQKSPPSDDQRAAAALLFAGPNALVTGLEACRRHGLRASQLPPVSGVHLLVPHQHKLLSSEFVTIERTHRMPAAVSRADVPLAPLVRAVLDATRRLRAQDPVAKLLIEAMQRGRCSLSALSYELEHGCPRGTAIPRRILGEIANLRSVAEFHGRRLSERLSTRPTHWNIDLFDLDGRYVACPDAWWDEVALAWEIDSLDFHFWGEDYARTLDRNTRYAAAGITVVQTLPSRLLKDPAGVIAELEAAYRAAAARPRPSVRVVDATNPLRTTMLITSRR